uniref:Golgi reassembly-stacking protein 2 n=1 Tax=Phallusia mammillata TaxID=59560 RepID=A0A6F9DEH3_9ASCI|nr:Golgi reassembly-stacking protein 2 [Phallusia mammillata]
MGGSNSVEIPGGGSEGYHVLRVQENSPGFKAGLEPFFDFIVMIGNTRLNKDDDRLKDLLRANVEKPIKMYVYSSKTLKLREVTITPSSMWGGQGLLGVSIRFCSFDGANENVWHVLEVEPNSPAYIAGLRPFSDYIIGADSLLSEQDDLFTLIESHDGRQLKLFVYNSDTDASREVIITPNSAWGGDGSLGCGIGYGYLHRIPTLPFTEGKTISVHHPVPPSSGDATVVNMTGKPPSGDGFAEVPLQTSVAPAVAIPNIAPPVATSSNLLPGNTGVPATASYGAPPSDGLTSTPSLASTIPGIPPLVNIQMPPTLPTGVQYQPGTMPQLNFTPVSGIAPLPAIPNLNLPPLTLPSGMPLPSLDSLAANLPTVETTASAEPTQTETAPEVAPLTTTSVPAPVILEANPIIEQAQQQAVETN